MDYCETCIDDFVVNNDGSMSVYEKLCYIIKILQQQGVDVSGLKVLVDTNTASINSLKSILDQIVDANGSTITIVLENVLALNNTTPFSPDNDYEPATKKYVDDTVANVAVTGLPSGSVTNNLLDDDIKVGSLSQLQTNNKSSVVGAVNELDTNIDTMNAQLASMGVVIQARVYDAEGTASAVEITTADGNFVLYDGVPFQVKITSAGTISTFKVDLNPPKFVLDKDRLPMDVEVNDVCTFIYDASTGEFLVTKDGVITVTNIDTVVNNSFVTNTLTGEKAYIAELTVDSFSTEDKVARYLANDTSDCNFMLLEDNEYMFITDRITDAIYQPWVSFESSPVTKYSFPYQAIVNDGVNDYLVVSTQMFYNNTTHISALDGNHAIYQYNVDTWDFVSSGATSGDIQAMTSIVENNYAIYTNNTYTVVDTAKSTVEVYLTEQVKNRKNELLYWVDDTHKVPTLTVTPYPILIYQYDIREVKMKLSFDFNPSNGFYEPKIRFGIGTQGANDLNGKAFIHKDANGINVEYYTALNATRYALVIGDDGILNEGMTGTKSIRNISVSATEPTSPQLNDLWIDTSGV